MNHMHVWYPWKPEEGVISSRTGVTNSCELLGTKLGSYTNIQTPQVFLDTGPFLQSLTYIFKRPNNEKCLSVAHVLRQS